MLMLEFFEENENRFVFKGPKRRSRSKRGGADRWPAVITKVIPIGMNRWEYEWHEMEWFDGEYAPVDDGKFGDGTDAAPYALNYAELDNDGQGLEGYGVDVSPGRDDDFSFTVTMRPITPSSIVNMWYDKANDGQNVPRFQAQNEIGVSAKCQDGPSAGTGNDPASLSGVGS